MEHTENVSMMSTVKIKAAQSTQPVFSYGPMVKNMLIRWKRQHNKMKRGRKGDIANTN